MVDPREVVDRLRPAVDRERVQQDAGAGRPDADEAVFAAGGDLLAVGAEGDGTDVAAERGRERGPPARRIRTRRARGNGAPRERWLAATRPSTPRVVPIHPRPTVIEAALLGEVLVVPSIDEQVSMLMYGAEFGDAELGRAMTAELRERLVACQKEGRPLRVYCGYDPSAPDIHLGHSITLRRLRRFQDLGHHVIFLIGTFTAQVGDTSDKTTGRPRKSPEEVAEACRSYADQCFKILDRDKTEVLYNGDWLSTLTLADVVEIASNFTVQQFLVRDNYRNRIEAGNPVGLHEFFYALLQGYDAHHLKADVQLGATEQLFNIMAGRKLQQAYGEKPCICITFPVLVGLDGSMRMSKSKGNYVGIAEPPGEQFGKVMSITDETMLQWIRYVTRWTPADIDAKAEGVRSGAIHPMELKKQLAWEVVAAFHGDEAADAARAAFESVFQNRQLPTDMPVHVASAPVNVIDLLVTAGLAGSRSKARQLIDGGGVRVDGERVTSYDALVAPGVVVQVGKRGFLKVEAG
jgi:tyrosyl-tRNA synthetase